MKQWIGGYRPFIAAVVFYFAGVMIYSFIEYHQQRSSGLRHIDEKLLQTVSLAEHLLQQELHDNLVGQRPLTPDEDYILSLKLQELADRVGVAYIYSLLERQSQYVFITSSPEPEKSDLEDYTPIFGLIYSDAPAALSEAFNTQQVQFAEYSDRWGDFRSVFFPFVTSTGQTYVIGVDVKISVVKQAALYSLFKTVLYGLLLGVIAFPLICVYVRTLRTHYAEKVAFYQKHPLTGLPNKRYLKTVLGQQSNEQLLLIEIENFDHIESTFGISATDELIVKLAYRLRETNQEGMEHCELFHLEDHQFALYTAHPFTDAEARDIIAAVFGSLTRERLYTEDQQQAPVVVRMGAVRDQPNALTLAGMALIHAKKTNQSLVLYEPSLNLPNYFRRYIDTFNLLKDALEHNRIKVFFQPIVNINTGHVVKYEALARLHNEEGEIVSSPDEFMPVAYQSRLCHKLTRVMITKVIEAIRHTDHIVSINLSVKDLFDENTRSFIIKTIRNSEVGIQIEFELLEQQVISNYRLAAAYITQLKSCVSQIGMDDLGKLYSNFDRLLGLPIDFVKIDGVVIEAIQRDGDARAIVEGVVSFAHEKGIQVIAEHCASEEICGMVSLLGVNLMQGFYLGKPSAAFEYQGIAQQGASL